MNNQSDPTKLVERLLSGKPTPLEREAGEALASLADELRLAREDARRYRWLRGNAFNHPTIDAGIFNQRGYLNAVDTAIDAAIKEPR